MKYNNLVSSICALFASSIVIIIQTKLEAEIDNEVFCLVIAVVVSTILSFAVEYLFNELPKNVFFIRRLVYPMAEYEGTWIQVQGENEHQHFALCRVEYIKKMDSYAFYGEHYSDDNSYTVKFNSQDIKYEETLSGFSYLVEGQHKTGEIYRCWGYITFSHGMMSKCFDYGKGMFVEMGSELNRIDFDIYRVDRKYIELHKDALTTKNSLSWIREFVRNEVGIDVVEEKLA